MKHTISPECLRAFREFQKVYGNLLDLLEERDAASSDAWDAQQWLATNRVGFSSEYLDAWAEANLRPVQLLEAHLADLAASAERRARAARDKFIALANRGGLPKSGRKVRAMNAYVARIRAINEDPEVAERHRLDRAWARLVHCFGGDEVARAAYAAWVDSW